MSTSPLDATTESSPTTEYLSLRRRVAINQVLWSIGYAVTSGAFLTFFLSDQGASWTQIGLILALPELVGTLSLFTRKLLRPDFHLKNIWQTFLVLSRLTALGIPICGLLSLGVSESQNLLVYSILFLAVSELVQAFSYTAYLSWLSAIAPEQKWGNLFAFRNVANLIVLLIATIGLGYLRDWVKESFDSAYLTYFYVIAFTLGCGIQFLSWLPLRTVPDSRFVPDDAAVQWRTLLRLFRENKSLRWLLYHNWFLSFANGLTQAVFYSLIVKQLGVQMGLYYLLGNMTKVIKIPISIMAGSKCDQNQEKRLLIGSLFLASSGLWFFMLATPEQWFWLVGVYLCWGAYAAANISGFNLLLKTSITKDNTTQIALFKRIGGLLAGLSGVLGGVWLDHLVASEFKFELFGQAYGSWHLIILCSLAGRYLSLLFLWPVSAKLR